MYNLEALVEENNFKSWRFERRGLEVLQFVERESLSIVLMVREEREKEINVEDEMREKGSNPVFNFGQQRTISGRRDVWARSP